MSSFVPNGILFKIGDVTRVEARQFLDFGISRHVRLFIITGHPPELSIIKYNTRASKSGSFRGHPPIATYAFAILLVHSIIVIVSIEV